jgi:hypothetical protein
VIRAVLAVALVAAILATAGPAIESVRVSHADARVAGALDRVEDAARTLAERNDAVTAGEVGARRQLTLRLPRGTWGTAELSRFSIGRRGPGRGTLIRWRVDGGARSERLLESVSISPALDGYEIRSGGTVRLRLSLLSSDGAPEVRLTPLANRSRRHGR